MESFWDRDYYEQDKNAQDLWNNPETQNPEVQIQWNQEPESSDQQENYEIWSDSSMTSPEQDAWEILLNELNSSENPLASTLRKINEGTNNSHIMKSLNNIDFKVDDIAKISDAKRQIAEAILGKWWYRDVLGNWENLNDLTYEDKASIANKFEEIIDNSDGIKREEYIDYLKQNLSTINWKDSETVGLFNDILVEEDALLYEEVLERYEETEDVDYQTHNQWNLDKWNIWWGSFSWWWNINWWKRSLDFNESSDKQIVSEKWVYDEVVRFWVNDKRKIAYILATVKNECAFKNQKEIWWENKPYWQIDAQTWKAYYGRWFVQLTHKDNYQKFTDIIRSEWKDFMDNDWNIIKWSEIDLVNNPDLILQSNDLALFILVYWMENWTFTWKKLDDFIKNEKADYVGARRIVNWQDKANQFAMDARTYENSVENLTV